jgi:acylphosphatase
MSPPNAARFVARVSGRVQGVGFRFFVQMRAEELRLSGSVGNRPDRSVRVEAEGPKPALDKLLRDLHEGPPAARVDRVEVEWMSPRGSTQFLVEAG